MSNENSFGNMLKAFRVRKGTQWGTEWSQQQLADKLEISRVTYNRWENNVKLPSAYYLKQLVAILELNEKDADALYRAAGQAPPIVDNLPFQRNPFFTGREEHLERLRKQLQETGTPAITQSISISGLGGIGKTELALEYAHSYYPEVYRVALWVDAADEQTLKASYDKLAEMLKLPERKEQELDRRIQAVKDWLQTHTNWLLIMDNADDLPLACSFLPSQPLGHVVFTTQSQIIDTTAALVRQIEIDAMGPKDGQRLLLRRSGEATLDAVAADIREAALEVVELLGGLPLALDQARAYIQETSVSFTDYIKRYHTERRCLLDRRQSRVSKYSKHPQAVVATLNLSIKKASEQHPLATNILHFCAFLRPDDIPEELFQHDESFKYGTTAFDDAIAALHRYSLIKRNTQEITDSMHPLVLKSFSMHRLVQAVLIDAMSPDLQKQWRERVVRALNAAFPEVGVTDLRQWERLLPHALVCATWTDDELTPTVEVATLFHKAAICLHARGHYAEAEALLARVLSIYEQHFGVEDLNTAFALNYLAFAYHNQGKYELAEPLLVRVISIREKRLGTEHPATASSIYMLAYLYHVQDEYELAEIMYRRALRIWEKHLDSGHPDIFPTLHGLAMLMQLQGQHMQAKALYKRALSIREQQLGVRHPHTQATKKYYANFLRGIGCDAEAAALEVNDEPSV